MYEILVQKLVGKRPLGGHRHRREGNIKISPKEIGCEDVDWIQVAEDRVWWWALAKSVMSIWVSKEDFLDQLSDYQLLKDSAPWS